MTQYTQGFIAESLLKGRIVCTMDLVHACVEQDILEACKIMLEHPGVNIPGGIYHLSVCSNHS
jgi:hypothetical protein